ncbi:NADH dehydrogenase [ubiquinone] 1 alpha subcomplex subunit 11 [Danaus plexippus]|uniref:NADH dehydrogenase [ubiquinone] 1 alpha subcomplex subunit 11 n=1 Tax=Danaus plexippus TaxID=13037 RepID=UPI0013C50BFC|nr:NADH dehydrogenase [ubiquinone] 1 alpha subcomplex subunit 11 [Danaus plexippus]
MLFYKYYDTPEGQDIYKKAFVTSKYAALTGLGIGTYDVLMYSHPKGLFNTAYRFGYFIVPMVGMATTFAVTANAIQNYRGKNDELNYFLGGAASGALFAVWQRSGLIALPAAVVLGVAAAIKKQAYDNNFTFFPQIKYATKSAVNVKSDWSLVKDVEELKTWTTGSQ